MSESKKISDRGRIHTRIIIRDLDPKTGACVNRQEYEHNCLLDEGITAMLNLLIGAAETDFSAPYIGVGDDDTAADHAQTGLQAAENAGTHKLYKAMDATYPQVSGCTVTFRTTFTTAEANFTWKEITIASGNSDAADNLNRKVQAMGTKTSAVSRETTLAITIT